MAININPQLMGVQKPVLEDPQQAAQPALIRMRAGQEAAQIVTESMQKYEALRNENELRNAQLIESEAEVQAQEETNENFYLTGTQLAETNFKGQTTQETPGGESVEKAIPSWMGKPDLLEKRRLDGLSAAAKAITDPNLRRKYVENRKLQINKQKVQDLEAAYAEGVQFTRDENQAIADQLLLNGDYEGANAIIANSSVHKPPEKRAWEQTVALDRSENFLQPIIEQTADMANKAAKHGDIEMQKQALTTIKTLIAQQVQAKYITKNEAFKRIEMHETNAHVAATVGAVIRYVKEGNPAQAQKALFGLAAAEARYITNEAQEAAVNAGVTQLHQLMGLQDEEEKNTAKAKEKRQEQNFNNLYGKIISGNATAPEIQTAITQQDVNPDQGAKLLARMKNEGLGVDDPQLIKVIDQMIEDDLLAEEILSLVQDNDGYALTNNTAREYTRVIADLGSNNPKLRTEKFKASQDYLTAYIRKYGVMGQFDTDAEKRLARNVRELRQLVLDGMDEWQAVDMLVDKYEVGEYRKYVKRMLGVTALTESQQIEAAIEVLNQKAVSGEINKREYDAINMRLMHIQAVNDADKAREAWGN